LLVAKKNSYFYRLGRYSSNEEHPGWPGGEGAHLFRTISVFKLFPSNAVLPESSSELQVKENHGPKAEGQGLV